MTQTTLEGLQYWGVNHWQRLPALPLQSEPQNSLYWTTDADSSLWAANRAEIQWTQVWVGLSAVTWVRWQLSVIMSNLCVAWDGILPLRIIIHTIYYAGNMKLFIKTLWCTCMYTTLYNIISIILRDTVHYFSCINHTHIHPFTRLTIVIIVLTCKSIYYYEYNSWNNKHAVTLMDMI